MPSRKACACREQGDENAVDSRTCSSALRGYLYRWLVGLTQEIHLRHGNRGFHMTSKACACRLEGDGATASRTFSVLNVFSSIRGLWD